MNSKYFMNFNPMQLYLLTTTKNSEIFEMLTPLFYVQFYNSTHYPLVTHRKEQQPICSGQSLLATDTPKPASPRAQS